ncbi:hypothetical protein LOTGIDRAFT_237315 [Lottia gigantea]|uniref:EF-hand domain-containing protein n=1 Tax=Lottia gigantea TaxID=225164 RepID=V4BFE4_LOTGI|nr:hypothetical protein LOTGIDRAFT_237315 [Lottia gigantea]ESP04567.1 hypothetical protein LOTGIDRAFT_237315 [Lottia gigantea]
MVKDPKTGKLVKKLMNIKKGTKTKGKVDKKKMSKAEKADYEAGKRNSDSESDFSYRSVYSAGGTRKVRRKKKNEDGTYGDSESYHSSQDEEGAERRKKRREEKENTDNETRVTSQSKDSDFEESDYSYKSDVSEGGTRTVTKQKRLRDEDGNVIGYGESEVVNDNISTGSISPRRGSISDGSETAYDRYMAEKLRQLDGVADSMDVDVEEQAAEEQRQREKLEEFNRLNERVYDPSWPGVKPSDKPNIELPNFDDQYKRLGGPRDKDKPGMSREKTISREKGSRGKAGEVLTEEEKKKVAEEQVKKQKEREKREKEMREKREMQNLRRELTNENIEKERENQRIADALKEKRRESVMSQRPITTPNGKHQSMVTYEKGAARDLNTPITKTDNRDAGLTHSDWKRKPRELKNSNNRKGKDSSAFDYTPTAKLNSLNRKYGTDKNQESTTDKAKKDKHFGNSPIPEKKDLEDDNSQKPGQWKKFSVDENGNISLKPGEKIDIKKLSADDLRKLGIDPNLSEAEIIKKLKEKLGDNILFEEEDDYEFYRENINEDVDLIDVLDREKSIIKSKDITGVRRVNLLLRAGGSQLQVHLQKVLDSSKLKEYYAEDLDERVLELDLINWVTTKSDLAGIRVTNGNWQQLNFFSNASETDFQKYKNDFASNIDEKDSSIDYMCHYRLVDPNKIDSYAKAFVVEDSNLDTVITYKEIRTALDGIPTAQHVTNKQKDYVFKVLHINDATHVTFRMFAVVTALCERITAMDSISKHLMEMCNLADIERKLDLYQSMFYHNIPCYRDSNFITSESLKIELIAGGLNWKQQKFIMEKMEPNDWGEISFLDYMCYIPLFMSMHDNIVDNPLDMSDKKYQVPPRKRPPSVQRDMNPLGQPLSQNSTFLLKKQAKDLTEGRIEKDCLKAEKVELLKKYAKLPEIPKSRESRKNEDVEEEKMDLIY